MASGELDTETMGRRILYGMGVVGFGLIAIYGSGIVDGATDPIEKQPAGPSSVTSLPAYNPGPEGPPCQGSVRVMEVDETDPMAQPYLLSVLAEQTDSPVAEVLIGEAYCPEDAANGGGDQVTLQTPNGILNDCVTVDVIGELGSQQFHVACAGQTAG